MIESPRPTLLFATHNRNKAAEIARMTDRYDLLTLDDAGVTADIPETATVRGIKALSAENNLHATPFTRYPASYEPVQETRSPLD